MELKILIYLFIYSKDEYIYMSNKERAKCKVNFFYLSYY